MKLSHIHIQGCLIIPSLVWMETNGFSPKVHSYNSYHSRTLSLYSAKKISIDNHIEIESTDDIKQLCKEIDNVATYLWKDEAIPSLSSMTHNDEKKTATFVFYEGEKDLPKDIEYSQRAKYFRREADEGCLKAQHSLALLLWNGFGDEQINSVESAKYHAAAAVQRNLDAMAVLGGCLRTGTGVKRNINLGLKLIDFSSSQGNPTGANKKAALLESNGDDYSAYKLYQQCLDNNRVNALLLFNLGWCYMNGQGVDKDAQKGIQLWKDAAAMAPDEGSEEAAWYIYEYMKRDNPFESQTWLKLSGDLGYDEALE